MKFCQFCDNVVWKVLTEGVCKGSVALESPVIDEERSNPVS